MRPSRKSKRSSASAESPTAPTTSRCSSEPGMRSAIEIASTPRRHFIEVYGEALGGRAQASRVHAQAQQTAAGSKLAALRLRPVGAAHAVRARRRRRRRSRACRTRARCFRRPAASAIASTAARSTVPPRTSSICCAISTSARPNGSSSLQKNPNIDAAVLAKLRRSQPLDVLLGRRPDLADLPLTCENTLTRAPLHRSRQRAARGADHRRQRGVRHGQDASRRAARGAAEPLTRGLPAAAAGGASAHAFPIISRSRSRARISAHLGVTRLELMRTLGKRRRRCATRSSPNRSACRPRSSAMVARAPAELWRHFGFAVRLAPEACHSFKHSRTCPLFLEATGDHVPEPHRSREHALRQRRQPAAARHARRPTATLTPSGSPASTRHGCRAWCG